MATQPSRQNVKTIETHLGNTQAMPDDRVLLTLNNGRSFVIDGQWLVPRADGTYRVELIAAEHR